MPTTDSLKALITRTILRQMAGGRSFERGEDYFDSGQVMSLVEHAGRIVAKVLGSEEYRVALFAEDEGLASECSCPMGEDGHFCKHCVAVGLAWLAETAKPASTKKGAKPAAGVVTLEDVRVWLDKQPRGKLVEIVLEQAAEDDRLRERLLLQAAKSAGKGVNVEAIREAMNRATRTGGFVDYRAARDFSSGIRQVMESIEDLLKQGFAAETIELTEYSLTKVEKATLSMDDSDGHMGGILSRLQEIHLAACEQAKPDPEELAKRLFDWEMRAEFDTFYGAAETYAKLLGARGLAVYRRCAEAAWEKVPRTGPGESNSERFGKTYRIKSIMEALARQSGDVDTLVQIKARDLSNAYNFLEIATLYREAKRHDDALAWAERGIKAFPERTDSRLREFLAKEYHRRKRHDEAMRLIWTQFQESPNLQEFQKLKLNSDLIQQWPAWRHKALGLIRDQIKKEKQQDRGKTVSGWGWYGHVSDHSLLVEIFLWEKDSEAAWDEAQIGGCHDSWWMQLAATREKEFPTDAIPIYQKEVENLIGQKHYGGYQEAVKLLGRLRGLMARVPGNDFATYLAAVRAAHKPKRNFMQLSERLATLDSA